MNRKGSALLIFIIALGILIAAGVFWYFLRNPIPAPIPIVPPAPFSNPSGSATPTTYANSLLKYNVSYSQPWRVATIYSKAYVLITDFDEFLNNINCANDVATIEGGITPTAKSINDCIAKYAATKSLTVQGVYNQFNANYASWTPETSWFAALTDLSTSDEQALSDNLLHGRKGLDDIPANHFIFIYPLEGTVTFATSTGLKDLKVAVLNLSNGLDAEKFDGRGFPYGVLAAQIPYPFQYTLTYIGGETKPAGMLDFSSNITATSTEAETIFFNILNSFEYQK